jgi:hypothetical protein
VAEALKREPGIQVDVVDGAKGEFTVSVDGQQVARKEGDGLPPVEQVLAAVKKAAGPTPAGAKA